VKMSSAEKLLKKIERDLAKGSTFAYHPENMKSLNRGLDKVCDAASNVIGSIRKYFTANRGSVGK
jgi:hypothetical protein